VLFSELSPKNISSSINIHTLSVQAIGASDLGQEGLPYPLRTGVPIHLIGISEYKNRFVRRAYYCAGRIRAITCACKLDANHQHIFDFVQRRDALLLVRVREEIRWLFSRTSAASSASKRLVGPTVRRLHLLAPSPLACQLTRRRCHLRWAPGPSVRVSPRKGTAAAVSSPRHGAQIGGSRLGVLLTRVKPARGKLVRHTVVDSCILAPSSCASIGLIRLALEGASAGRRIKVSLSRSDKTSVASVRDCD